MIQTIQQKQMKTLKTDVIPKNWPFKTFNGTQTKESIELESKRFVKSKVDVSDLEEGLF